MNVKTSKRKEQKKLAIMLANEENLTKMQQKVYRLLVLGMSYKEIAFELKKPVETIKSHIRDIKLKGKYQKQGEIIANYWCEYFGASFEEQKKSILSACACLIILFTFSLNNLDKRRFPIRSRKDYIESAEINTTL